MARRTESLPLLLVLVLVAGCEPTASPVDGGPDPGTDAGDPRDAPGLDAAEPDAAASDAPDLDAPGLDALGLDAPMLDAPMLDALGLDAPSMDAGAVDAPGLDAPAATYAVRYDANGATSGTPPMDAARYAPGASVTVAGAGTLDRTGFSFAGWNTSADGLGTARAPGSTFVMGASDVTLYAVWTSLPTYAVTYHADDRTAGTVPTDPAPHLAGATVTVAASGDLVRTGYSFSTWSTTASGSGTSRAPGSTFSMPASDVDLYARWDAIPYTVTYDANGASGGTVPVDGTAYTVGASVTVRGNTGALVRTGYTFGGWNTQADGLGTAYAPGATFAMGAASVTLYAVWTGALQTIVFDGVGGTGSMASISAPSGSTVTLPANAFSRAHWAFAGWGTSLTGWVVYADRASFTMPASSLTLYAKWTIPMVAVAAGTFRRDATATNTSTVSAFQMARFEITVDQILELGFTDTTGATNEELPFDDASWYLALVFCNRLSIREGRTPVYAISGSTNPASWGAIPTTTSATWDAVVADWTADGYRMPTEMEWLWGAMGATGGATGYTKAFPGSTGSNLLGDYAWLGTNSGGVRHVVGTRMPNELGIYDLAGNAYEHVWDREDDYNYVTGAVTDYRGPGGTTVRTRVYRGGAYDSAVSWARLDVLGRSWQPETYAYSGIRVVRR